MTWLYQLLALYQTLLPDVAALEFTRAQEEFVIEQVHPVRVAEQAPLLIQALVSRHYVVRQDTVRRLQARGREVFVPLVHASVRHPDPYVRWQATRLLDRIYRCPYCLGTGDCPACGGPDTKDVTCSCDRYRRTCWKCGGSGDLRYEFDSREYKLEVSDYVDKFRLRNLYDNVIKPVDLR